MQIWLSDSLSRHYPSSAAPAQSSSALTLHLARGERGSFQFVCRTEDRPVQLRASVSAPEPLQVRIRRVGYVPVPHHNVDTPLLDLDGVGHIPGYCPDPLFPDPSIHAGPCETHAWWVSVVVPPDTPPGRYPITVTLEAKDSSPASLTAMVVVHPARIPPRRDFPVTHWFYADALCDWYRTTVTEEAFWRILDPYLANVADHGQDTIYVPVFTPPLDGVRRPMQLLGVQRNGDRYTFDWSLVRRWIAAARAAGLTRFEWCHLFTQWGVKHALRIYEGQGAGSSLLWPADTGATSPVYRNFLAQFLPELHRFVQSEGLLAHSFFHVSDEPHGEEQLANYRAARDLLRELAPWMKVMDAISDIRFARERLIDIPVPILNTAPEFVAEGYRPWTYFCCVPKGRYLNRFLDTPLVKIRMSGWLFYRTRVQGFLHWGYNSWYKSQTTQLIDPFTVTDALRWPDWAFGDPFVVYPGPEGPIDSLRWEVFAESLQDYALLQAANLDPADPMLAEIVDYASFPRDPAWIQRSRLALLDRLA